MTAVKLSKVWSKLNFIPNNRVPLSYLYWPLPEEYVRITQLFGVNPTAYKPFNLDGHDAIDISCPLGTDVYAVEDGTIVYVGYDEDGWGRYVWLKGRHSGIVWRYNHLDANIRVIVGNVYNGGDWICNTGNTGNMQGPHLDFGALPEEPDYNNGYKGRIDPMLAMSKDEMESEMVISGVSLWPQAQGQNYESWFVEAATRLGGVKLLDPDRSDSYKVFLDKNIGILGRLTFDNNADTPLVLKGAQGAEEYFNNWFWPRAQKCPEIQFWMGPNECAIWNDVDARAANKFWVRLAELFHAHGLFLGALVFSTGHPEIILIDYFAETFQYVDAILLHAYSRNTLFDKSDYGNLYRPVLIIDRARANGFRIPPVYIDETGIDVDAQPDSGGWRAQGISEEEYTYKMYDYAITLKTLIPELRMISPFISLNTGWSSYEHGASTLSWLVTLFSNENINSLEEAVRVGATMVIPTYTEAALAKYGLAKGMLNVSDEYVTGNYVNQIFRVFGSDMWHLVRTLIGHYTTDDIEEYLVDNSTYDIVERIK